MISNKKINISSSTLGFSRGSTVSKSDIERYEVGDFDRKNNLNCPRGEKPTNTLARNYFHCCEFSEGSSISKIAFNEEESNESHHRKSVPSSSTSHSKSVIRKPRNSKPVLTSKFGNLRDDLRKQKPIHANQNNKDDNSNISLSTEGNSTGSFLSNNSQGENSRFVNHGDDLTRPLRLFNKSGKPLTDRVGRALVNILGERLVVFDDRGRAISDWKGNQVFNSRGESAIYPSTNLYIPPSEEEPSIPLLDINKEHILFLYDNKGHPLTDSFGRPLLCASGNPMIGLKSKALVNISDYEHNELKKLYSRKPLENFLRLVQIFDSDSNPLTNDCGRLLEGAKVICNKNGMPMCDCRGLPIFFKYGCKISTSKNENTKIKDVKDNEKLELSHASADSLAHKNINSPVMSEKYTNKSNIHNNISVSERCVSDGMLNYLSENSKPDSELTGDEGTSKTELSSLNIETKTTDSQQNIGTDNNNFGQDERQENCNFDVSYEEMSSSVNEDDIETISKENSVSQKQVKEKYRNLVSTTQIGNLMENVANLETNHKEKCNKASTETVYVFNPTEKLGNQRQCSLVDVAHFEAIKERQSKPKTKQPNKNYSLNLFQYLKDTCSKRSEKQDVEQYQYNEFGKPLKDIHGNLLYDKYGMPLTGAQGRRLSERARLALRSKLKNVQKIRTNIPQEGSFLPLPRNESHDQFGEPVYDKYGRPLYDIAGRLIYDRYGRPLTDAFGRPLVDAIGQPLMDCEGRVLTSGYDSDLNTKLIDIFGRKIYDKRGRTLFDSYGRPKYDIFTNAIYDSCGRPATDANGNILFDFLNKSIKPYPDKPLCKNARDRLPKYVDTLLSVPSMNRVLKYSQRLEDVFGGPLFDDFGRPLYNKLGKPLFDRYGRPLYSENGAPLCDCYGRPLSEDIKESDDDNTLSVVDCLKLLKVTEESSRWMISKSKLVKSEKGVPLNKSNVVKISCKKKCSNKKSGQYVYALTRVTRFSSGRRAMEILEAPLSQATVAEMHRLPLDNKPLVMVVGQRHKQTIKKK